MKLKAILTAALLLAPTAALAAPGVVTVSTGLRAGPGPGFPLVDRIPGGARVNIHGCLRGYAWCDVSWSDDRGWVSSAYLEYLYRNHFVYLPDYVDEIDVPVVPFVLSSYWSSYYAGRPWYQRRAYWGGYWTSHQREASRLIVDRSAARIGREATRSGAIAEGRSFRGGTAERFTRERGAEGIRGTRESQFRDGRETQFRGGRESQFRGAREMRGREDRFTRGQTGIRENNAVRAYGRLQQPEGRAQTQRFSAGPAGRAAIPQAHVAQPNANFRSPANARAQMPAPHAAPAMPQGGAPHMNAAPRNGGGPAGGGGPGRERH
jgi:uncharacterized protein YraI